MVHFNMRIENTRRATIIASTLLCATLLSMYIWLALMLIPLVPVIATVPVMLHLTLLLYLVPACIFLTCGRIDPKDGMPDIEITLTSLPGPNLNLCMHAIRYVYFVITNAPTFITAMIKHVYLPRVRRRVILASKEVFRIMTRGERKIPEGLEGCCTALNMVYGERHHRLDVYYPAITAFVASPDGTPALSYSSSFSSMYPSPERTPSPDEVGSPASDNIHLRRDGSTTPPSPSPAPSKGKGTGKDKGSFDPFHVRMKVAPEYFGLPSNPPKHVPKLVQRFIPASPWPDPEYARPVVVFFHDYAIKGPIKSHRRHYALLARKLVDMGYVVVVPDIGSGPNSKVEDLVTDIRAALDWTYSYIGKYAGAPKEMFVAGHGLGAHLASATIMQEAIVQSQSALLDDADPGSDADSASHVAQPSTNGGEEAEHKWSRFAAYGEHIPLPNILGLLLFSPVVHPWWLLKQEVRQGLLALSSLELIYGEVRLWMFGLNNLLKHTVKMKILDPARLPQNVLMFHGLHNKVVPPSQNHNLHRTLTQLGVNSQYRTYETLGHWDMLGCLMKGFESDLAPGVERAVSTFIDDIVDEPEAEPEPITAAGVAPAA